VTSTKPAVVLVGHGGVPADCPPALISELKRLEAEAHRGKPSPRYFEVDAQVRTWPRTPETDPYKAGLEAIAEALGKKQPGKLVLTAYNEFCAPSLQEAVEAAIAAGCTEIQIISTMYTRGGIHSETEIPQIVAALSKKHPRVTLKYAWPFSVDAIGDFLAAHL
jgi:sirohydrochlorin cobaltochelatase